MSKYIDNSTQYSLRFHYDEELFNNRWASELDPTSLVLLNSGVMVESAEIASMIAGGSNYFTIPFYKDIEGDEVNYDGKTDIPADDNEDGAQSGVVYGRAKGWKAQIFVNDFTGADPMGNILARINKWKGKKVQSRVIGILNAILGIEADGEFADWNNHKMDISATNGTPAEANKIGLTTLRDVCVQALGDNADKFDFAIMHSKVANDLSKFNVLEYFKYNDARGQELDVKVGRNGNLIVLICDEVPVEVSVQTAGVYTIKIDTAGVAGDTIKVFNETYSFVASGATGNQINIGSSKNDQANSLKTLLSAKTGPEVDYTFTVATDTITATLKNSVTKKAVVPSVSTTGTVGATLKTTTQPVYGNKYTTYILGRGTLLRAPAPVEKPSDVDYKPAEKGGTEYLYTRYREAIHPNGFTFSMANLPVSPADSDLEDTANWKIVMNPKNIAIARLICN